jgi:cytochrome oxidase Cu insertion factor (SCO1/SenC/PrrC family)
VAGEAGGAIRNQASRRWLITGTVAAVLIVASAAAIIAVRWHQRESVAGQRPSGIPASVPTGTINLMGLSPVPASPAPGFTLMDQNGRALPLSRFRGKVVVLESMDPHCTDICPLVSQQFIDAYHDLGRSARHVVFAAVNVNQYFNRVRDVLATRGHTSSPPSRTGISSPGRPRPCARSGATTASRCKLAARTPTSCTPRPSTSSALAGPNATSPRRWPITPATARPTFRPARSAPGAVVSPSSPGRSSHSRQPIRVRAAAVKRGGLHSGAGEMIRW